MASDWMVRTGNEGVRCTWSNEQGEREEGGGGGIEGGGRKEGRKGEGRQRKGRPRLYFILSSAHLTLNLSRTYLP